MTTIATYLTQREALIRDAVPGDAPARHLARLTDEMLGTLALEAAAHAPARGSWAIVALGGYGAGALLPASDLDLLVVTDRRTAPFKPFVEALLYPLWDAGLAVGHQVRSRKDQLTACREDLKTLTSSLTGRFVAGDADLAHDALAACAADASKRRSEILGMLHARPRPGSPYLLEPDLKDGAGGRRDFDELTWTASLLLGTTASDPEGLVDHGVLSHEEWVALAGSAGAVITARWELQRDGGGNLMSLETAEESVSDPAAVQRALVNTHHTLLCVRSRLRGEPDTRPSGLAPQEVFGLLADREHGLALLESAAAAGALDALIPGFADLGTLRRPGIGHELTVGAHSLVAAHALGSLETAGDATLAASARAVANMRPVLVAALVHDAGKTVPGPGHAERGARLAFEAGIRFGLEAEAPLIEALVRHHLLLAETATHADLDDEDAILRCAAVIGDPGLVAPLHLLTMADSRATGANGWTEWHATLVGKLVSRLDAAFSPDIDGVGIAGAAEQTRAAALAMAPSGFTADFVASAPLRYLADRSPEDVVRHARLVEQLAGDPAPGAFELDIATGPVSGSHEVTIVTRDRPGLFALLAGVLSLSGLDILAVRAASVHTGIALDTFVVHPATGAATDPSTWARAERSLGAALRDRFALGVRLAERRRHYRAPDPGPVETRIVADDPFAAVVRIRAADRPGLLHDIARAIADSGLDIRSVTATTRDGIAIDTFRLVDASGGSPAPGLLGQLKMRLRDLG